MGTDVHVRKFEKKVGWGTRIRTSICRVRAGCSAVELCPSKEFRRAPDLPGARGARRDGVCCHAKDSEGRRRAIGFGRDAVRPSLLTLRSAGTCRANATTAYFRSVRIAAGGGSGMSPPRSRLAGQLLRPREPSACVLEDFGSLRFYAPRRAAPLRLRGHLISARGPTFLLSPLLGGWLLLGLPPPSLPCSTAFIWSG